MECASVAFLGISTYRTDEPSSHRKQCLAVALAEQHLFVLSAWWQTRLLLHTTAQLLQNNTVYFFIFFWGGGGAGSAMTSKWGDCSGEHSLACD